MGRGELVQEQPAEQPRQHPHRQEEARLAGHPAVAGGRQAATGDDAVDVGMVGQGRAPGVQHQGRADLGAEVLGIGGDGRQGLRRHREQQPIEHRLVGIGDGADRCRQGEHHVVVRHRQQLGLAVLEPLPGGRPLALRAMAVAAGVVGDLVVRAVAVGTAQHVAAERGAAALLDRRHDLELAEAEVTGLGLPPRRAVGAEDVRDLEAGPRHRRPRLRRGAGPPGRGARAGWSPRAGCGWRPGCTARWSRASCGRAVPG